MQVWRKENDTGKKKKHQKKNKKKKKEHISSKGYKKSYFIPCIS